MSRSKFFIALEEAKAALQDKQYAEARLALLALNWEADEDIPSGARDSISSIVDKLSHSQWGGGLTQDAVANAVFGPESLHYDEELTIVVFAHTRASELAALLTSLGRQDALRYTEVWLDGDQGRSGVMSDVDRVFELARSFSPRAIRRQRGGFGFRKQLLTSLRDVASRSRDLIVLEDDCFITSRGVEVFRQHLDEIRDQEDIFSTYGHHFGMERLGVPFNRFQGWGWATTSDKWSRLESALFSLYLLTEKEYLAYVDAVVDDDLLQRIDVTPGRQPSQTFKYFFAWDEALTLLCGLLRLTHLPTRERVIYNCGMGSGSTHFEEMEKFRQPPFNMITVDEVWARFLPTESRPEI